MLALPLGMAWLTGVILLFLDGRRPWVGWLAVAGLAGAVGAHLGLAALVFSGEPLDSVAGGWPEGVGIRLRADALGVLFTGVALGLLLAALLYEVIRGVEDRTLPAVVLFLGVGLTGAFLTGDVFNFYVFFEVSMMASFVLVCYGQDPQDIRNAVTFMVVNLVGTVTFLTAVAGLYHLTGTLDMAEIARYTGAEKTDPVILPAILIFVAFGLKLGLFPFHAWLPPVYRETRPVVAAILSGVLANLGSYGLLRFGAGLLPGALEVGSAVLVVLGSASILYGAVLAVPRKPTREVLAYSSISQAGYIMVALGVGGPVGYAAAVVYTLTNSLNKTLLFLTPGLRGRWVGAAFLVGALSVAGVPPVLGFFAKAALFRAGLTAGSVLLMAVLFLGGALAILYMFRAYQREFWIKSEKDGPASPASLRAVVLALAGALLLLGVWPEPLLSLSRQAVATLPEGSP